MADEQDQNQDAQVTDANEVEEENTGSNAKTWMYVAIGAIVLLAISLVFSFIQYSGAKNAQSELSAKNKEVQQMATEIADMKDELNTLEGINQELDNSLENAYSNMADKDILLTRLTRENQTLKQIRTKVAKLNQVVASMEDDKNQLKSAMDGINSIINKREAENAEVEKKIKAAAPKEKEQTAQN